MLVTYISLILEKFRKAFESFKTMLSIPPTSNYNIVYEIICKYTKLIIISLSLLFLCTNLIILEDYLLLFAKKITKKKVGKRERETSNELDQQTPYDIRKKTALYNMDDGEASKDSLEESDLSDNEHPHKPKKCYPKSQLYSGNTRRLSIIFILITFYYLISYKK